MAISQIVKNSMVIGSYIRRMFEEGIVLKKVHGDANVFDLSLGNPILEPPGVFKDELYQLVNHPRPGMHLQMEDSGYAATREAVATQISLDTGLKFKAKDIVMAFGAAGAVNAAFKTLLNPGEEVISFVPNYFEYVNYSANHGGGIKYIPADKNLNPNLEALEAGITTNTKAIIINSPNNPTGHVYTAQMLKAIAEVVTRRSAELKHRVYIVSDDVYSGLYFGQGKCPRIVQYYPHTIVGTSYSKDLSLPGERIGYLAVHPECEDREDVIKGLVYANQVLGFINPPATMQNVVSKLKNASVDIDIYRRKRDLFHDNLTEMGYSIVKPQGAFYIFPTSPNPDDEVFVQELKQLLVLTVPGHVFRAPGYFRLCYCVDDRVIEGSLKGFKQAIAKYKK
jgi:aspartate aminotransferase